MNTADSTSLANTPALKGRRFYAFADLPVRAKMLLAFLAVTVISASLIAFISDRTTSDNLTVAVGTTLQNAAAQNGLAVGNTLERQLSALKALSLNKAVKDQIEAIDTQYQFQSPAALDKIKELDRMWSAAGPNDPLIGQFLNNQGAFELKEYGKHFPDNAEVFVTDRYGALVAATNRTSDYYQADETWWQAAWNNGKGATYIGQPEFDESSQSFSINLAVPITDYDAPQLIGVLRTTYRLDNLLKTIDSVRLGETGRAQLLLPGGQFITPDKKITPLSPEVGQQIQTAGVGYTELSFQDVPSLISVAPVATIDNDAEIAGLSWQVLIHQNRDESLEPVTAAQQTILLTSLAALLLAGLLALVLAQLISSPIARLTAVASEITAGDLSRRLEMRRRDEIGLMAANFDTMAQALEARIATEQEAREKAQQFQQGEAEDRQTIERAVAEYLDFVQQIAQGDLSQRLTPQYEGALGQLGQGLSHMVASLHDITSRVQEGTNAIAAAVAQISAATAEQAASSAEQSAAITETATAIEEVKVIALQTADQATQVAQSSQAALEVAWRSDQAVAETVGSMGQIRQQVTSIAETIHRLSEQTRSISMIITSVSELADQINHLALNAAIETTRAGDQDKDVALLARLVRDLGSQAKDAAKQVRHILSEIQDSAKAAVEVTAEGARRVDIGVGMVTETGAMIHQIAAEVESGAQANMQMAAAAQQQTQGMQQIGQAILSIQQATTQTLAGTRQAEQAAQDLLNLAQSLQQAIAVYRL